MSSASFVASKLFDVTGQVTLVTGGGTGIGLTIAKALASNGAKVYIGGRRKDVVERAAKEYNGNGEIVPVVMDVTQKESIKEVVNFIEKADGKLNILVNNAGITGPISSFLNKPNASENASASSLGQALFESESFEEWNDCFRANTSSIYFTTVAFLGLLGNGGNDGSSSSVLNISSISGLMKLNQNHFAYNTSKAAVIHLSKMLATEFALKKLPIRVNCIAPGVYATEMTFREGGVFTEEETNAVGKGLLPVPARRNGTEEEMAATALYLLSHGGQYTNGQVVSIDGGYLAVNPSVY